MKLSHYLSATLAVAGLAACSAPNEEPSTAPVTQSGMNLTTDILADTDVARMAYSVTGVDCETGVPLDPAFVANVVKDLEDVLLPGGHSGFENQPFDANSQHLFADLFLTLAPGCYDVAIQPIDADGAASADCHAATQSGVQVQDGQTTEILLVSQCDNNPLGALDAIAAINHAPQLVAVTYDPSKFTCDDSTRVCVEYNDPDDDPVLVSIAALGDAMDDVVVTLGDSALNEAGNTVVCADIEVPGPGEYSLNIQVFDQMFDADGQLVTIESVVAALGDGLTSNDALVVPVHAMNADACVCDCPEGFALNDSGSACERFDEVDAVFNGNLLEVCEGDDDNQYGALGAEFPGGTLLETPFFGDGHDNANGRLNAIGIWDCAGTEDEWIGFSACIDVEVAGEYVIGMAVDDRPRAFVDGNLVFSSNVNLGFRRWWMTPIQLTAGSHVVELEGYDTGTLATMGAEIYGPFPAGSTANDASLIQLDYENNIIWSTGDQLGGFFQTGTNSGYSCPDGYGLNQCGEVATCTSLQEQACQ